MARKAETALVGRIRSALKREFPKLWVGKYHGGPMSIVGMPDLFCIDEGRAICFEVKILGERMSKIQEQRFKELARAHAYCALVTSPSEAIQHVINARVADQKTRKLPF